MQEHDDLFAAIARYLEEERGRSQEEQRAWNELKAAMRQLGGLPRQATRATLALLYEHLKAHEPRAPGPGEEWMLGAVIGYTLGFYRGYQHANAERDRAEIEGE